MSTVVITGTSRGIGKELTRRYRERGHRVVSTSRKDDGDADHLRLDVTDPDSFETLTRHLGQTPVDLLIRNAGVYNDKSHDLDSGFGAELWAEAFATNVTGAFLTIQRQLPNLRAANSARVALLSSQMASHERAPGGSYIYRASKAAVLNLGRNLATDLKPQGISVGIYHPGWVRTEMGGEGAEISVEESAEGLMTRFEALGPESTGCFETWDGQSHPY